MCTGKKLLHNYYKTNTLRLKLKTTKILSYSQQIFFFYIFAQQIKQKYLRFWKTKFGSEIKSTAIIVFT